MGNMNVPLRHRRNRLIVPEGPTGYPDCSRREARGLAGEVKTEGASHAIGFADN